MVQQTNVVQELIQLDKEFKAYQEYLNNSKRLTNAQRKYRDRLRDKLLRKVGSFKGLIVEVSGKQYASILGAKYDVWSEAFNPIVFSNDSTALSLCIQAVNEAIGKLESEIDIGKRTKSGQLISKNDEKEPNIIQEAKAFIAHGGESGALDKLKEYLHALGINPLIVELLPSRGMTVDDKVSEYIRDADCGIVLATQGGIIDKKSRQIHPRLNVIDEYERLRAEFPDKTILLVERGVTLPSNIAGIAYEPFVPQSMDRAFIAIARELTAYKILKATKPD